MALSIQETRKLIDLCALILADLRRFDEGVEYQELQIGTRFASLSSPLLSGGELVPELKDVVDVLDRHVFTRNLRNLGGVSTFTRGKAMSSFSSVIVQVQRALEDLEARQRDPSIGFNGPWTVFYSWQATSPNSTNRGFIGGCVDSAASSINTERGCQSILVDRDTKGRPGSPKIFESVIQKIGASHAFVADVTLIFERHSNSNVMVELGYALAKLGMDRIVMVCNTHNRDIKNLPFDLGFNRVISYDLAQSDTNKAEKRRALTGQLKAAIEGICSKIS